MPLMQMSSTKTVTSSKIFGIPLTSLGNHIFGEKPIRKKGAILVDLEKEQLMKWACKMQDWTQLAIKVTPLHWGGGRSLMI
jgi:hypothetical protein